MDNLQYINAGNNNIITFPGFKPYYKWIIFNIALMKGAWF